MTYEEKFIVINMKRFKELNDEVPYKEMHEANDMLLDALDEWKMEYEHETGKKLNQKYYVVNQDEPYADKVWDLIKEGENED